jgi:hypothetical protein
MIVLIGTGLAASPHAANPAVPPWRRIFGAIAYAGGMGFICLFTSGMIVMGARGL